MPLTTRLKRLVSSISNRPPPYDPDTDEFVGATLGKKYALDYDASRRTSRGSISFDETRRPSVEYSLGRPPPPHNGTSPRLNASTQPRTPSPASINAALSDAGIGGGGGGIGGGMGGGQGNEENNEGGDEGTGMMRRGSAGVVGGNIVVKRGSIGMNRSVRPDGLRCQICKELLTYASGHKLNPLDNGLFCNTCVSLKRHRDPSSFREYALTPTPSVNRNTSTTSNNRRISRTSSLITRSKSNTSTTSSTTNGNTNGNGTTQLSKVTSNASSITSNSNNKPLSDTGPMPNPAVLFDLTVIRPFHLGGYFPVKCSRCSENFEICHDRYAGARCTLCKEVLFDICGTCLANPENGAYIQLLRHKEGKHPEVFCNREIAGEVLQKEREKEGKKKEEGVEKAVNGGVNGGMVNGATGNGGVVNRVNGSMVPDDHDMDGEGIDPLDTSNNAKGKKVECNGNIEQKEEAEEDEEELPPVLEWILYQPPGRIFGPAWRVAATRNSV